MSFNGHAAHAITFLKFNIFYCLNFYKISLHANISYTAYNLLLSQPIILPTHIAKLGSKVSIYSRESVF